MPFSVRDPVLLDWLARLDPEDELVARLAVRGVAGRFRSDGPWNRRIDELMAQIKPDEDHLAVILRRAQRMGEEVGARRSAVTRVPGRRPRKRAAIGSMRKSAPSMSGAMSGEIAAGDQPPTAVAGARLRRGWIAMELALTAPPGA